MKDEVINIENPDFGNFLRQFADGSVRNLADLPSMYVGKGTYNSPALSPSLLGRDGADFAGRQRFSVCVEGDNAPGTSIA